MTMKISRKHIEEAIAHWQKMLKSLNEATDDDHGFNMDLDYPLSDSMQVQSIMGSDLDDTTLEGDNTSPDWCQSDKCKCWQFILSHKRDWRFLELVLNRGFRFSKIPGGLKQKLDAAEKKLAEFGPQSATVTKDIEEINKRFSAKDEMLRKEKKVDKKTAEKMADNLLDVIFNDNGNEVVNVEDAVVDEPIYIEELMACMVQLAKCPEGGKFMYIVNDTQLEDLLENGASSEQYYNATRPSIVKHNGKDICNISTQLVESDKVPDMFDLGTYVEYSDLYRKLKALDGKLPFMFEVDGKRVMAKKAQVIEVNALGDTWFILAISI